MMTEKIKKLLKEEHLDEWHGKLLGKVKGLVAKSRADMSNYYSVWDERHRTYRAEKLRDRKDRKAAEVKDPVKQVVPLSYAQVDTFVAFGLMTLMQRKYVYELDSTGAEDFQKATPAEMLVDRDMRNSKQTQLLYQFLLDCAKFSLGAIKCCWVVEYDWIPMQVPDKPPVVINGVTTEEGTTKIEWKKVVTWRGNKLYSVSPYRVFPDTRIPLTRYQEGEFLATEEETTFNHMRKQEKFGVFAGTKHVQPYKLGDFAKRGVTKTQFMKGDDDKENVILTEVYVDLIPKDVELPGDEKLGEEDFPIRYVVTYANDSRIVRLEPYGYLSRVFPVFVQQFNPDMHELINQSLAEIVGKLQEVADWFFNSRVASVTRTLDNQMVVDPSGVDMATVNIKSRVILLKKNAARQDPRKFVHQLSVTDVTARHLEDMNTVAGLMPQITGVSENSMGVATQGRRSAYEMRAVSQGSTARIRKVFSLMWEGALAPMGQTMITNQRQGQDFTTFQLVVGQDATPEAFAEFKGTPEELVQNNDLIVFDGTLPSDKLYLAQSLQEILTVLLSNPEAAVQFNLDPKAVMEEMYRLRGVTKLQRFAFQGENAMQQIANLVAQQLAAQNGQPAGQSGGNPGPQV